RGATPAVGLLADARLGLRALADELPRHNRRREPRTEELRALKARADELVMSVQPQAEFALAIRESLPPGGVIVHDVTQIGHWAPQGLPVERPLTLVGSGYQGTLGCGLGIALGVKVANPTKPVVAVCGDGGLMYQIQELATAALHNINVIGIVFNDSAY